MRRIPTHCLLSSLLLLAAAALPPLLGPATVTGVVGPVERVVVHKGTGALELWQRGRPVRRYPVAFGFDPQGHKQREGDGRTPEGAYRLSWRTEHPRLGPALLVSYPSPQDAARARQAGEDPGGGIFLHGLSERLPWDSTPPHRRTWTQGCIGLRRAHMAEVYAIVAAGTPITIRP